MSSIIPVGWRLALISIVAAFVVASGALTPIAFGSPDSTESAPTIFLQGAPATPQKGPPGSLFTVRESGFRSFVAVNSIKLGGRDVLGSRTVNTDADGAFTAEDLQVPGLDPGRYALVVTVGRGDSKTTGKGIFEVTA